METKTISLKQKRHRKFLLVLPLIVLPFVTMAFWTLGGGVKKDAANVAPGLNTSLPSPDFKGEQERTKMELYALADKDSLRRKEQLAKDPFYKMAMDISLSDYEDTATSPAPPENGHLYNEPNDKKRRDPNEVKVMKKLAELNKALDQSVQQPPTAIEVSSWNDEPESESAAHLSAMMDRLHERTAGKDPQMEQMEAMLDKILDIQHPERAVEKTQELSLKNKQQVYPVGVAKPEDNVSLLERKHTIVHRSIIQMQGEIDSIEIPVVSFDDDSLLNSATVPINKPTVSSIGFYGLEEDVTNDDVLQNAIEAVVAETQTIVTGSTLKLQLLNDCYIAGQIIKAGQFVYGQVNLNGERLEVTIPSVKNGKNILPVSMSVYDMDGLAGIYMPGAISRDVAKNSAEQAVQSINFMNYDPSLASQATSAGITAAKTLFSKKARLIRVNVKAGYKVLLRDNNQSM